MNKRTRRHRTRGSAFGRVDIISATTLGCLRTYPYTHSAASGGHIDCLEKLAGNDVRRNNGETRRVCVRALRVRYTAVVGVHKSEFTFGLHGGLGTYRREPLSFPSPTRLPANGSTVRAFLSRPVRLVYPRRRAYTRGGHRALDDRIAESSSC